MVTRRFWSRQPTRLLLDGARWPHIVVLAVTPSGLLIEAPSHPPIDIGTVRDVELHGLRGMTVIEESYPSPDASRSYYSVRVVEYDDGLLAAIESCVRRRDCTLRVVA
jgi:hypothetical protein